MRINLEICQEWRELRDPGDMLLIAESIKVHPETIRLAIRNGNMSERVFHAINDFYTARKARVGAAEAAANGK